MDARKLKALEIAARCRIVPKDGAWLVPSQSGEGTYCVTLGADGPSCGCEDFLLRREACKHVLAVQLVVERDGGAKAPAIITDAPPPKRTYRQNWPLYNKAQATEKDRFQVLLHDLCQGLSEFPQKSGRPRTRVADAVFGATFKVYSTFSSRRFSCDMKAAYEKGYLSKALHYNNVNAHLNNPDLTPVLRDLIVRSSLPLRAVETDFAVDSSGFLTSRFVRWFDQKYGRTRAKHDWVKVHIMTGVKTNVVTAIEVHGRDASDPQQFKPLLETTAQGFKISEVSGDKAYGSLDNFDAVAAVGGTPFVAFKSNTTGGKGGLWEKMFAYYTFRREEFLAHYHKRSNVESTFSMVKAKFRDHIRSKTDAAMANEVLCKFLAHNICVVHQSQIELGIEPVFWPAQPAENPDVLPLARPG